MSSSNGFQSSYGNDRSMSSSGMGSSGGMGGGGPGIGDRNDRDGDVASDPASSSFFVNDYKK